VGYAMSSAAKHAPRRIGDRIEVDGWSITKMGKQKRKYEIDAVVRKSLTVKFRGRSVSVELRAPDSDILRSYEVQKPWVRNLKAIASDGSTVPAKLVLAVNKHLNHEVAEWN